VRLMLVQEGLSPDLLKVPGFIEALSGKARGVAPPGYTLGQHHLIENQDDHTIDVVWEVHYTRSFA
jgi:hypothetical protein